MAAALSLLTQPCLHGRLTPEEEEALFHHAYQVVRAALEERAYRAGCRLTQTTPSRN